MPRYVTTDKHCVDCKSFETCDIRRKSESNEMYEKLDAIFKELFSTEVFYHAFKWISLCGKFEKRKHETLLDVVLDKVKRGEVLDSEEQAFLTKFLKED